MSKSALEDLFESQLDMYNLCAKQKLPKCGREFVLFSPRKWRFDFVFCASKVIVEIEGGTFSGGRHTSGKGFQGDCDKYNYATARGWKVFRFTGQDVKNGSAITLILDYFRGEIR